ncbi:hypothetical protein OE88DRAFT_1739060 [Heliocybe sulcata]|uniref:Uncharacterized protein n=1 Tax=Heliocybe sulcata TaxID=5364 RepID=A0A5C3MPZ1_9AGAM|nr:hypothetical protein OE88DRAFT_1739060 [Heliocybe sulcata]
MGPPPAIVIPLAIRFVPYDQWLVTHISASWKTKQVKQYILSKCLPFSSYVRAQAPEPPQPRSLSPITFASVSASRSRRSLDQRSVTSASAKGDDEGEDEFDEEDEDDADDVFPMDQNKYVRPTRDHYHNTAFANARPSAPDKPPPPTKSTRQSRADSRGVYHHSHFSLLTFSTSHLLEDDYTISWYRLRPYELLEMHLAGAIIRLHRDTLFKYIEPYFECKVKTLRVVHKETRPDVDKEKERERDRGKGKEKESNQISSQTSSSSSTRIRSTQSDPSHPLPLRKSKIEWREKWIIIRHGILRLCKDRGDSSSSQAFPLTALRSLRGSEHLQNASNGVPSRGKGETIVCAKFKQASSTHAFPSHSYSSSSFAGTSPGASGRGLYTDEYGRRGSAGRLGMSYDGIAEEREDQRRGGKEDVWIILDMIDEYAYTSLLRILHRHAPNSLSSSFLPSQSDSASSVLYPEWRVNLVGRARKVGMGDLGPVLEWVLLGDESKNQHKRRSASWNAPDAEENEDEEEEPESEKEWEHWAGDLERQRRVRTESKKELYSSYERDAPASPPLPPMRVFSPPPSSSVFASGSHSGVGGPFTERGAMAMGRTTTTSTVTAGGRVRSTTVSVPSGAKPPSSSHGKGPALKLSLFGGGSGRDGEGVRYEWKPGEDKDVPAGLRHATSLENVRGSEGWDGRTLHSAVEAGPRIGGGKKKRLGLVRGISVRAGAERLVKGLDSALDFVEGK